MAILTTLQQIEEVQAAITKVMDAQVVSVADKSLQRAKLEALTEREKMLLVKYRAEQGTGGIAINHGIPRRVY